MNINAKKKRLFLEKDRELCMLFLVFTVITLTLAISSQAKAQEPNSPITIRRTETIGDNLSFHIWMVMASWHDNKPAIDSPPVNRINLEEMFLQFNGKYDSLPLKLIRKRSKEVGKEQEKALLISVPFDIEKIIDTRNVWIDEGRVLTIERYDQKLSFYNRLPSAILSGEYLRIEENNGKVEIYEIALDEDGSDLKRYMVEEGIDSKRFDEVSQNLYNELQKMSEEEMLVESFHSSRKQIEEKGKLFRALREMYFYVKRLEMHLPSNVYTFKSSIGNVYLFETEKSYSYTVWIFDKEGSLAWEGSYITAKEERAEEPVPAIQGKDRPDSQDSGKDAAFNPEDFALIYQVLAKR